MTDEVIGGPCTNGCGDVAGHPGVCLVTALGGYRSRVEMGEHKQMTKFTDECICGNVWPCPTDLEHRLAEAQARLRKANCDYGNGWLSDDLECGVDVEPWCGKHAVLYYIRANKEAQGKLDAVARAVHGNRHAVPCDVLDHILKEGE